jgi:hypothetical protein
MISSRPFCHEATGILTFAQTQHVVPKGVDFVSSRSLFFFPDGVMMAFTETGRRKGRLLRKQANGQERRHGMIQKRPIMSERVRPVKLSTFETP